jgi:predicted RNase H-like HicB family nuclease
MPKTIKPRSETARGRRRASSGPALAHGGHPITLDVMVRLQAIALPEADGGFTVVIPALGCATHGDTIEEAQANAVESAEGWLLSQHKQRTRRSGRPKGETDLWKATVQVAGIAGLGPRPHPRVASGLHASQR